MLNEQNLFSKLIIKNDWNVTVCGNGSGLRRSWPETSQRTNGCHGWFTQWLHIGSANELEWWAQQFGSYGRTERYRAISERLRQQMTEQVKEVC